MNGNKWVRQVHRWLGVIFTLVVVVNIVVMAAGRGGLPPPWLTYVPLPPLVFLMLTGLHLFVRPYVAKGRSGRGVVEKEV